MRSVDLGLKTALIVTPVSVLHKRTEFTKWRPCELKPLHIFMHDDFPREKRVELLTKWKDNGGVLLIGYAAFRNLFLGKYVKDRDVDNEISCLLQNKERTELIGRMSLFCWLGSSVCTTLVEQLENSRQRLVQLEQDVNFKHIIYFSYIM